MLDQLLKVAYPELSENSSNLESYYLVRLGELWGEGLIEEYLEGLQQTEQITPNPSKSKVKALVQPSLA